MSPVFPVAPVTRNSAGVVVISVLSFVFGFQELARKSSSAALVSSAWVQQMLWGPSSISMRVQSAIRSG